MCSSSQGPTRSHENIQDFGKRHLVTRTSLHPPRLTWLQTQRAGVLKRASVLWSDIPRSKRWARYPQAVASLAALARSCSLVVESGRSGDRHPQASHGPHLVALSVASLHSGEMDRAGIPRSFLSVLCSCTDVCFSFTGRVKRRGLSLQILCSRLHWLCLGLSAH